MENLLRSANPFKGQQAPDNKALAHSTTLSLEKKPLSTPAMAQLYFEPGINTKLKPRRTPKTNYVLPSDLPKLPIDFVPTQKGAQPGDETSAPNIVLRQESLPGDLLEVFARIEAEEKVLATLPKGPIDVGSRLASEYMDSLQANVLERKIENMVQAGFTEAERQRAIDTVRIEEAIKKFKEPAKPMSVQAVSAEIQTDIRGTDKRMVAFSPQTKEIPKIRAPGQFSIEEMYGRPAPDSKQIAMFKAIQKNMSSKSSSENTSEE